MAQKRINVSVHRKKKFNRIMILAMMVISIGSFYHLAYDYVKISFDWAKQKINAFVNPKVFSFKIERVYSFSLKQKMIKFLHDQVKQVNLLFFQPCHFYSNIKKNFDIIKKFSWQRVSIDMVRFSLVGAQPCYIVNESCVVADDKKVYDMIAFSDYSLVELPHCFVDNCFLQKAEQMSHLFSFLDQVPREIWQAFMLTYQSPDKIILKPKKWLTSATILTTEKTLLDTQERRSLVSIFYDLCQKKLISEKKVLEGKSLLTFDLRFNNRVVVKIFEKKRARRGV